MILAGRGNLQTRGVINPHNFWMEVLSQYGIVIFGLLVGFVLYLGTLALRLAGSPAVARQNRYWPLVALSLGTVGYWFAASENSSYIPQPINWVFLGSITALACDLVKWTSRGSAAEPSNGQLSISERPAGNVLS
jgi:hypothetical protein